MDNNGVGSGEATFYRTVTHTVHDTDYFNYAVIYGCDDYFGGIYSNQWARLLSRSTYVESQYIEQANDALDDLDY